MWRNERQERKRKRGRGRGREEERKGTEEEERGARIREMRRRVQHQRITRCLLRITMQSRETERIPTRGYNDILQSSRMGGETYGPAQGLERPVRENGGL